VLLTLTTLVGLVLGQPDPVAQADVLILTDGKFPPPPCPRCTVLDVRDTTAALPRRARALILVGHSGHPGYLGLGPEELARTVARLVVAEPTFLVADTCYGAEVELLRALVRHGVRPHLTVAATEPVAFAGFTYGDLFDGPTVAPADILREVHIRGAESRTDPVGLTTITAAALDHLGPLVTAARDLQTDACHEVDRLIRKHPNLLPVRVDGADGDLLVALPRERFTRCYADPDAPAPPRPALLAALLAALLVLTLLALRSPPCSHSP
jgi:hypothetical protein